MDGVRRNLILITVLFSFLLVSVSANASILNRRQRKQMGASVVQISVYDWRGIFLRQGWGFFVNSDGHIVTVRHLLDGGFYVEATTLSRESLVVDKIHSEDEDGDLVSLGLEMRPARFGYITESAPPPEEGTRILVGGGTGCEPGAFLDGLVENVREAPVFGYMMKINSPYAVAGSPVFTLEGRLVGIVIFRLENGASSAWAVPVGRVAALMAHEGDPQDLLAWAERRHVNWLTTPTGAFLQGLAYYWEGNRALAMPKLKQAARDERLARDAQYILGECCEDVGRHAAAAEAYAAAIRLGAGSAETHLRLARARFMDGDPEAALRSCWTAIRQKPNNYQAYNLLAGIYNSLGNYEGALAGSYMAGRLPGPKAQAFYQQGVALKGLGRYTQAAAALKKAISLDPELKKAYWDLAVAYYRAGDIRAASDICQALRNIDPAMSEKLSAQLSQ